MSLTAVFAALANDERLAILRTLADSARETGRGASISSLADAVGITRFSASRHLRILATAGLVTVRRSGHALIHRLEPAGLDIVEDWLYAHLPDVWPLQSNGS